MTNQRRLLRLADAFLAAVLFTIIAATGKLDYLDNRLSDRFYQAEGVKSSDIIVIGIDNLTLNNLGPNSSIRRRDMARAIKNLNENPNGRPAVIGIDALFTGENSADPEGDRMLVEAVAQYGNVVVGAEADLDADNILIPPFYALNEVVDKGHINAPNEEDGVARHEFLYIITERGRLDSFSRVIYEKFCLYKGIEPNAPPPTDDDGIYYLPFTAKSYAVENNFWDLLEGTVSSDVYRDKIVLIGPYAQGLQDSFPTALDRSDWIYGVDIHANAIQAFQKGFFTREAGQTPQLVILFILTFAAEFLFRRGKMHHIIIYWLTICSGWLVLCEVFYQQEIILPLR